METYRFSNIKPDFTNYNQKSQYESFISGLLKTCANVNEQRPHNRMYATNIGTEVKNQQRNDSTCAEDFKQRFPQDKEFYHNGYLQYLLTAWRFDCGIEFGPWYVWNIILHQICTLVNREPEKYRKIFTNSDKKIGILWNASEFDIHKFITLLKPNLPNNIDVFLPKFNSPPTFYNESMLGLFAETVKHYYETMILACSIPAVRIMGDIQDWHNMRSAIDTVNDIFVSNGTPVKYFDMVKKTVDDFILNLDNSDYWKDLFSVIRCGSGSQEAIKGYIKGLLLDGDSKEILTTELPDMISRYPFKDLNYLPAQECNFISGIMYSYLDDDNILVPEYHTNVTFIDVERCRLTDMEIVMRQDLLKCAKILKHYGDDYSGNHKVFIPYRREKPLEIRKVPSYEQWSAGQFACSADDEQYYKIYIADIIEHNDLVTRSGFNIDRYTDIKNEARLEKLKSKFCIWIGSDHLDPLEYRLSSIDIDFWLKQTAKYVIFEKKLISHMKDIVAYIGQYRCREMYGHLVKTYNMNVYDAFFAEMKKKPFDSKIVTETGGGRFDNFLWKYDRDDYYNVLIALIFSISKDEMLDQKIRNTIIDHLIKENSDRARDMITDLREALSRRIGNIYNYVVSYNQRCPRTEADDSVSVKEAHMKANIAMKQIISLSCDKSDQYNYSKQASIMRDIDNIKYFLNIMHTHGLCDDPDIVIDYKSLVQKYTN